MYYESHITIEPKFGEELEKVKRLAENNGFRVADLFLQKRKNDTPERSKFDSFMTARSNSLEEITFLTDKMVEDLGKHNYFIFRYKIEITLIDVKMRT